MCSSELTAGEVLSGTKLANCTLLLCKIRQALWLIFSQHFVRLSDSVYLGSELQHPHGKVDAAWVQCNMNICICKMPFCFVSFDELGICLQPL